MLGVVKDRMDSVAIDGFTSIKKVEFYQKCDTNNFCSKFF